MNIGLLDVDGGNFPNLALMKLSAWHKAKGDTVEFWEEPIICYDRVYMSKVFSNSQEPEDCIRADEIIKGGTGYHIHIVNGKEIADNGIKEMLPYDVEHIYPDYSLYGITDTAYGFMSRGCPKGLIHGYCHVAAKEGLCSVKVANLNEFWNGQKYIELMDPNTLACKDAYDILQQLADSGAMVDFNQGLDIQLLENSKSKLFSKIKIKHVHFAWDNYADKNIVIPKFEKFKSETGLGRSKVSVYVLTNYNTSTKQDIERIQFFRGLDFQPYPMIYNKSEFFNKHGKLKPRADLLKKYTEKQIDHAIICQRIQRWCNPRIFWSCERFEDYGKEAER